MEDGKRQIAIISILFAELIGLLSSLFSGNTRMDYEMFAKPPLSPPGWLFGLVWIILYAMMGYAYYLIVTSESIMTVQASALYFMQLFVNFLWSIVFFGFDSPVGGLIVIVLLDILVIITIWAFGTIKKKAAYIMIPYLLWILFATYLNAGIVFLN